MARQTLARNLQAVTIELHTGRYDERLNLIGSSMVLCEPCLNLARSISPGAGGDWIAWWGSRRFWNVTALDMPTSRSCESCGASGIASR